MTQRVPHAWHQIVARAIHDSSSPLIQSNPSLLVQRRVLILRPPSRQLLRHFYEETK
jgi:hypothetical protein